MKLKVVDVYASGQVKERASIIQSKTQRPVRFEITEGTRKSLSRWMEEPLLLGHTKMDSTVRYLGVDLEDALAISESVEI